MSSLRERLEILNTIWCHSKKCLHLSSVAKEVIFIRRQISLLHSWFHENCCHWYLYIYDQISVLVSTAHESLILPLGILCLHVSFNGSPGHFQGPPELMEPTTNVTSDRQRSPKSKKKGDYTCSTTYGDTMGWKQTLLALFRIWWQWLKLKMWLCSCSTCIWGIMFPQPKKWVFHGSICRMSLQVRIMHQVL